MQGSILECFVYKQRSPGPIQDSQGEDMGVSIDWIHQHILELVDDIRKLGSEIRGQSIQCPDKGRESSQEAEAARVGEDEENQT